MTPREALRATLTDHPPRPVPQTIYQGLLPPGGEEIEGLGLIASCEPYVREYHEVEMSSQVLADATLETTWETPVGTLTKRSRAEEGYGSQYTQEFPVKRPADYAVLEHMIRHATHRPAPEVFTEADRAMGDRGIVYAWMDRTPFQRLWIEWTGIERGSLDLYDCPAAVEAVLAAMFDQAVEVARLLAESPAEFIWLPDNLTGVVAGPPTFRRYLAPYYEQVCAILHAAGKVPLSHMDGLLQCLVDEVGRTDLRVIEAFTPPPDGDLPLAEAFRAWPGKAIWINFPSSVHLAPPERIKQVTRQLVAEAEGRGLVISVTENIPAHVGGGSLRAIAEALQE